MIFQPHTDETSLVNHLIRNIQNFRVKDLYMLVVKMTMFCHAMRFSKITSVESEKETLKFGNEIVHCT